MFFPAEEQTVFLLVSAVLFVAACPTGSHPVYLFSCTDFSPPTWSQSLSVPPQGGLGQACPSTHRSFLPSLRRLSDTEPTGCTGIVSYIFSLLIKRKRTGVLPSFHQFLFIRLEIEKTIFWMRKLRQLHSKAAEPDLRRRKSLHRSQGCLLLQVHCCRMEPDYRYW